ncbi:tapasin-related protein [Syngnathoides biaculeatus]|uniref:tapasin-related protein n=1 Tax=Syngnathoides biaculeatus TaxID=300417 RepID=UPI002ADD5F8D|nr:tapasin-related protein [Syngnathoides biaculeatus]XP_061675785.1 tapasin-related protein [Syngnathoides biaculeatus]XP_061675786.1 tapasin-related protein [Syngnathoides biaculeatus]
MKLTGIILCGFFATCACASGVADIVLSCKFVENSLGQHALTWTPATLILREVIIGSDESLEALTPFVPPPNVDPRVIILESKASSFEIPNAAVLLHANCNEQEVMCEISSYTRHGSKEGLGPDDFLVSIVVEGGAFSTLLILRVIPLVKDQSGLIHDVLGLSLTQDGMLLTEVSFLVFSTFKSLTAPLRGFCLLNCGFRHQDVSPDEEVNIEWYQQDRGRGQKVVKMVTRLNDPEGSAVFHPGSGQLSNNAVQVVSEGNASVTLNNLKVTDEGAYICSVTVGPFRGQQVVKLHVAQPPSVSLSKKKLILKGNTAQTLSCHCSQYYPLEAQVEWLSQAPTDEKPLAFPDQGSLSSHRKHGDGTYSLSSHLVVPPGVAPGTRITCRVSHTALDAPVSVSVLVEHLDADDYLWVLSILGITVLFFYQLIR